MRFGRVSCVLAGVGPATVVFCLSAFAGPAVAGAITDLTAVCGLSYVFAVNAGGEVAGSAFPLAASCSGASANVFGASSSYGYGINASGQIVGNVNNIGFLYSGGVTTTIEPFGVVCLECGDSPRSDAYSINSSGQIVGDYYTADQGVHAYVDSGGVVTDLSTLLGLGDATATAINDNGQIVGQQLGGFAFLDSGGVVTYITPDPSCGTDTATGINSSGAVVGSTRVCPGGTDYSHAYLYFNGVLTDLGTLGASYGMSLANGINDSGEVVGESTFGTCSPQVQSETEHPPCPYDAFLYSNGVMIDLNSLLPANSGFTDLVDATAINDSGQIIGYGYTTTGAYDAFLLNTEPTSAPEPGSAILLGAGLALSLLHYRRKTRWHARLGFKRG